MIRHREVFEASRNGRAAALVEIGPLLHFLLDVNQTFVAA
jgi:hypothetical protein